VAWCSYPIYSFYLLEESGSPAFIGVAQYFSKTMLSVQLCNGTLGVTIPNRNFFGAIFIGISPGGNFVASFGIAIDESPKLPTITDLVATLYGVPTSNSLRPYLVTFVMMLQNQIS